MATTSIEGSRPNRPLFRSLFMILAGAGVLLVIGVVVAVLSIRQPETAFAPGSPEGAVSTYLQLLQNGQVDQAYAMTSFEMGPPYYESMTREQFHQQFDAWSQAPHRVTLLRSSSSGSQASVTVEISTFQPDLFASADRTFQQTFTLTQRDVAWVITGPGYLG